MLPKFSTKFLISGATEFEDFFFKIDNKIKRNENDVRQTIQLYINLTLIAVYRSYQQQHLSKKVELKKNGTKAMVNKPWVFKESKDEKPKITVHKSAL